MKNNKIKMSIRIDYDNYQFIDKMSKGWCGNKSKTIDKLLYILRNKEDKIYENNKSN